MPGSPPSCAAPATIWWSICTASYAPRCSRSRPARRCGSDSTGRVRACGTLRRANSPEEARKHAWQGAREGSWLAYTHHIPVPTLDLHAVDRYLNVGPMLGLEDGPPDFSFPIPRSGEHARVESLLQHYNLTGAGLITMAPGTIWETKHWGNDKFAEVARHFLQKGFAVALMGIAPRARRLRGRRAACSRSGQYRRRNHAHRACGAHSPLGHQRDQRFRADASGRRARSSGGERVRPDRSGLGRPLRRRMRSCNAGLPCSPCYLRQLSRCHYAHACMRDVSAGAVIERMESILHRGGAEVRVSHVQAGVR